MNKQISIDYLIESCKKDIKRLEKEKGREIELLEAKTFLSIFEDCKRLNPQTQQERNSILNYGLAKKEK